MALETEGVGDTEGALEVGRVGVQGETGWACRCYENCKGRGGIRGVHNDMEEAQKEEQTEGGADAAGQEGNSEEGDDLGDSHVQQEKTSSD